MPYHDVKILNVKDMEIEGHFNVTMMYCYVVENLESFQDRPWGSPKGLDCWSTGFVT